jgi:copper chaperone NosL
MDRRQYHHSRMLIQYSDDLPDGVCSLHCAAISLAVNVDREPKTIWVADNASTAEIKPLIDVDQATFLIGSQIKGVMSKRSKVAYGSEAAARRRWLPTAANSAGSTRPCSPPTPTCRRTFR